MIKEGHAEPSLAVISLRDYEALNPSFAKCIMVHQVVLDAGLSRGWNPGLPRWEACVLECPFLSIVVHWPNAKC